jgi:hypothetical protein
MLNILNKFLTKIYSFSKYLNFTVFLITFLLGLIYMYCFEYNRKVVVYPTPHNIDKIEYKDEAGNCYGYKTKEVKCPSDKSKITNLPL